MKTICIITPLILPVPTVKGGAIETLVEYLLQENEKEWKYDITVLSILDAKALENAKLYKHTKFIYIKKYNSFLNRALYQLHRFLKYCGIYVSTDMQMHDVYKKLKNLPQYDLYVYEPGNISQLLVFNKIIPSEKIIVHLHGDCVERNVIKSLCSHSKFGLFDRTLIRYFISKIKIVEYRKEDRCFRFLIAVSNFIGKRWIERTNCENSKILVLPNCVQKERFNKTLTNEEKTELKSVLGISQNDSVIIFAGRIVKEKGVKELIEAFSLLKNANVTLLILGGANFAVKTNTLYEKEVQDIAINSKKHIVFTGYISHTDVWKYYNIADIAVMPSLCYEAAPLACLEAQLTGTPLIATKVGGLPEYVTDKTAVLINWDEFLITNLTEQIENLLCNPKRLQSMSLAGKAFASSFNTETYFRQFSEIVENATISKD